ncbi:MAG: sigma-54 dependent transcriptional regulator [Alcanivoracaceae bacterium]|jgi:two-component system response regulator PilR (NtrC family)|nr:sigma-54 dependent transcriptional regulator [Alcanivoracaceae bacterium]
MENNKQKVLIIDDEADLRELLVITLGRMNLDAKAVGTVAEARDALAAGGYDLCLTDMNLPDGSGLDLVKHVNDKFNDMPVAVITAYGSMETATEAMKEGAFDFIAKPVSLERLKVLIDDGLGIRRIAPEKRYQDILVGQSPAMDTLREQVGKLARSQAPIYIRGESGSGKELVARLIHNSGSRREKPFVPVNCGAIPSELMESEFFGHRKGSFTGAFEDRKGLFREADGGTLFLDEVADLPLHMQVKLLRAIQEKSVRPVGESRECPVNVRILCATHKDLTHEVAEGRFRQDLYYRINVIEAAVPSLRERPEDIPELVDHVLERLCQQWEIALPSLTDGAMAALKRYSFPGNVRELENILERALTLAEGNRIDSAHLQLPDTCDELLPEREPGTRIGGRPDNMPLEEYLQDIERQEILQALDDTHWNRTAAAKKLGMTFRSLRYRLQKLSLDESEDNGE